MTAPALVAENANAGLKVVNLRKSYKNRLIIRDVTLDLAGRVVRLVLVIFLSNVHFIQTQDLEPDPHHVSPLFALLDTHISFRVTSFTIVQLKTA